MSTLLDESAVRPATAPAQRLRATMAAARVSISWLGVRKTLTPDQRDRAAGAFGAEGNYLSAAKKLLDTGHPSFRAVTTIKNRCLQYWKGITLPFPENGIRLIPQHQIEAFDAQMNVFQGELTEAVENLDRRYSELKTAAQRRLGSLYNAADYPESLQGLFQIDFDFPSVEPPNYLQQLHPDLYRAECERVAARFDQAVQLAEEAFTAELSSLVSHLAERLSGQSDGQPKVFRDSAVTNLLDFFNRFGQLNVRSNDQLDELVERARQVIEGRWPQELRADTLLRQTVAEDLSEVRNALDEMMVDRPRRNILRRSHEPEN